MTRSIDNGGAFRTTSWSIVMAAGDLQNRSAEAALAKLCEIYYQPLFSFVRRRGYSPENSEDLIQGFFAKLLEKNYVNTADRSKGKFRTFMLSALKHYLSNEARAASRLKRGKGYQFVSLDFNDAEMFHQKEVANHLTPEMMFEQHWALSILRKSMAALESEYDRASKPAIYKALSPYLTAPEDAPVQTDVAAKLGMSHSAVRVQVHRMKQRFGQIVRAEIIETLTDPGHVDEEVHAFMRALSY